MSLHTVSFFSGEQSVIYAECFSATGYNKLHLKQILFVMNTVELLSKVASFDPLQTLVNIVTGQKFESSLACL